MEYQICTRCIMDTSDSEITFDENGVCNHCHQFDTVLKPKWYPNEQGRLIAEQLVEKIKKENISNEYDCVLGLSGGVDSSYLAYIAVKMGLRILAVHVDAGWNSEIAVQNIEKICKKLKIDLHTIVVDWEEMKELQRAYLYSGLANQDVPQDHIFFSALYSYAVKNKVRYVLNGSNYATEGILPASWGYDAMDVKQIKSIIKIFSRMKIKKLPMTGYIKREIYYNRVKRMEIVRLLNYIPYTKKNAIQTLEREFGWKYYGGKHFESRFTKYFQSYYLPVKFGYDKRRAHLSSLIVAGEITREEALIEMKKELYTEDQIRIDREYIIKKLDLSEKQFEKIMNAPNKTFLDYPSSYQTRELVKKIMKARSKLLKK